MKKFLSLVLALSLVLSCGVLFSSCSDELKEKDVSANPMLAISTAMNNTNAAFYEDSLGLADILHASADKAVSGFYFESADLLGGEVTRINATMYADKNGAGAADIGVTYNGEVLDGTFYYADGVIGLGSADLGLTSPIKIDMKKASEAFPDSFLADMFAGNEGVMDEFLSMLEGVADTLTKPAEETEEKVDIVALSNELCAIFGQTITTKTLDDGAECFVLSFTVDNAKLRSAVKKVMEKLPEDAKAELENMLNSAASSSGATVPTVDEIMDMFDEACRLNLSYEVYINKATNTVPKTDISLSLTAKENEAGTETSTVTLNLSTLYTADKITFALSAETDGETVSATINLTKTKNEGNTVYAVKLDATKDSVTLNALNASLTVQNDGNFTIEADVYNDGAARITMGLAGKVIKEDGVATIEFNSLTTADMTVSFKLGIFFGKTDDNIPALPADAKDLLTMSDADAEAMLQSVMSSPIMTLLSSLGGSPDGDDYYGDDYNGYENIELPLIPTPYSAA